MNLTIPYERLCLIPYHGAGNKTPVLDINAIEGLENHSFLQVKSFLETNKKFRKWLKNESKRYNADSVMIYYQSDNKYITFVGEPNASIYSKFSDMCGNGVRCLVLHILLHANKQIQNSLLKPGVSIWAGDLKTIKIIDFKPRLQQITVAVKMGRLQKKSKEISQYINKDFFKIEDLSRIKLCHEKIPPFLQQRYFGVALNSNTNIGEPHLVLVNTLEEIYQLAQDCGIYINDSNTELLLATLSEITAYLGTIFTFAKEIFPQGINFNLGVIVKRKLYMATHERNILSSRKQCLIEQKIRKICRCVTMACGTGGAVTANIARIQNYITTDKVITNHRGGIISYLLDKNNTIMIGSAEKIISERKEVEFYGN